MRVVSSNSPSISLITQANAEAGVGTVTNAAALGGRQIVTVPAGQAGLAGAKGPVQITITPASRGGAGSIIPITLPSGLRQVAKPLVVGGTATAGNGAQVLNIRGSTPAQVVTVNPSAASAGAGDQPAQVTILRSEADSLTEVAAAAEQNAAVGDGTATIQQFDGAAYQGEDSSEDGDLFSDEEVECDGPMIWEGISGVCQAETDIIYREKDCYFLHSPDHVYAVNKESDLDSDRDFVLPQYDGAGEEDGGGEDAGEGEEQPAESVEQEEGQADQQEQPLEAVEPIVADGTEGITLEGEPHENTEGLKEGEEAMQTEEATMDPSLIGQVRINSFKMLSGAFLHVHVLYNCNLKKKGSN